MDDLDSRLDEAVALRNRLSAEAQRIAGRKEAAEKTLAEVEAQIRSKNLDPEALEQTLKALNEAYHHAVQSFEGELAAAQEALAPYMETPQ